MDNEDAAHHHAGPRPAEIIAAQQVQPHVETLKKGILQLLAAAEAYGRIPDEVDGLINTVRRRFTELWKEGKIRPTELTRLNRRGNPETVWVLGRDDAGMTAARVKPAARIQALEAMVLKLTVAGQDLRGRLWHHAEHPYTHSYSAHCACDSCLVTRAFDALVQP